MERETIKQRTDRFMTLVREMTSNTDLLELLELSTFFYKLHKAEKRVAGIQSAYDNEFDMLLSYVIAYQNKGGELS